MNTSPSSALGTCNSYSEHKLITNDNDTSDSIISLLSVGTGLGLDNNTLDKTSVTTGEHIEDHENDDEGLTFGDFEQDDAIDVAPVYVVP